MTIPKESADDYTQVACVRDSVTAIIGYSNNLQTLLGNASEVGNFGVSGSTVSLSSVQPYLCQNASKEITAFHPAAGHDKWINAGKTGSTFGNTSMA